MNLNRLDTLALAENAHLIVGVLSNGAEPACFGVQGESPMTREQAIQQAQYCAEHLGGEWAVIRIGNSLFVVPAKSRYYFGAWETVVRIGS
jgi:hypothetical protein